MLRVLFVVFLLASSAPQQIIVAPPPPPPPPPGGAPPRDVPLKIGTGTIRGRVVADGSGAPVPKVEIRITATEVSATKMVLTDANGRYELPQLPSGKFTIGASKPNYVRVAYGQKRPQGQGQPIDLANGQTLTDINFTLQRAGVISGIIADEFGEPVVDVQVMPSRLQYVAGERRLMPVGRSATTNDLGEYRLYGLAPGQYFIMATLRSNIMGDVDDRSGYAPTYFPGTANIAEAQKLPIGAAQTIGGINMTLLPTRTSRIIGRALDSEGRPLTGGMVMALARTSFSAQVSPAQVRPDGSFTISGLTPGDYIVRVGAPGPTPEAAVETVSVNLSGGDVTGVELKTGKPAKIRGRLLFEQGVTPPRPATLNLGASSSVPMMGGGQGRVDDDYTFEILTTPGHFNIRVGERTGPGPEATNRVWQTHAVRLNGLDITDSGVEVPSNGVIEGVTVEVTNRPTELTGKVLDAAGQALRDVWVVAFSQDQERWTPPTRWVSAGRPDLDHVFKLRVPAGDYFVAAVDELEPGEWNDPDVLSQLRERAIRVSVADFEKKALDLKLNSAR